MSFGLTVTITIIAFHLIVRVLNVALYLNPSTSLCSDYEMLIANTRHCVSRCPLKCINDICFEDGVCPCENFYTTSSEKGLICSRECLPGCKEAGGYCAGPDLRCLYGYCDKDGACTCFQGYKYQQKPLGQFCIPECKQDCGRLGYCFLPNMCACRKKSYHYGADGVCHRDEDYIY
uniref:EGF-like domain-containing protein n=1 Tax=Glossina pallidipes TaxID=7398 RepID=A0A1A9ZNE6_GLOPL